MKNHNKTRLFASIASMVFLFCQLVGSTAAAGYRGYWVDAVHQHQANHNSTYQTQPIHQAYPNQEPVYQSIYEPVSGQNLYPSAFNTPAPAQAEYLQSMGVPGQGA